MSPRAIRTTFKAGSVAAKLDKMIYVLFSSVMSKTGPKVLILGGRRSWRRRRRMKLLPARPRRKPRTDQVVCQHFGDVRDVGDPSWRPDHTESQWPRTDTARLELVIPTALDRSGSAFQKASQFVSGSAFASKGLAPSPVAFQNHKVLGGRPVDG